MRTCALAGFLLLALVGCNASDADETDSPPRIPNQLRQEKIAYEGGLGIFVANPDGTGARQLTEGDRTDMLPAWSADGRRIAFVRGRPPHEVNLPPAEEIHVMNADGSDERRLTRNRVADLSPRWLPDGRIVFLSCPPSQAEPTDCSLVAIRPDGTGREELAARLGYARALDVSPDGQGVVYVQLEGQSHYRHFELHVMNLDGTDRRRLTDNDTGDVSPAWSPDGKRIAFASNRAESAPCLGDECTGYTNELYVMDADGGDVTRLTETPHDEGGLFSWSPDGTRILYARIVEAPDDPELLVMNADGSCPRKLRVDPWTTVVDWYGPADLSPEPLHCWLATPWR